MTLQELRETCEKRSKAQKPTAWCRLWSKGAHTGVRRSCRACILNARLIPVEGPVRMHCRWAEPNRRRDWDNVTSARKFIQDALVGRGILRGDGQKHVMGFDDAFCVDRENPGCLVTIEDVGTEYER